MDAEIIALPAPLTAEYFIVFSENEASPAPGEIAVDSPQSPTPHQGDAPGPADVESHAEWYSDYHFPRHKAESHLQHTFRDNPAALERIPGAILKAYGPPDMPPLLGTGGTGPGWTSPLSDRDPTQDKPPYSLIWLSEVTPKLDTPALVRGVITRASMVVTYGESNSGKTFHVMDRDLCVSTGRKWYDRECEKGFVLYVAAEGAHSVMNRLSAYRDAYILHPDECLFAVMPGAIDLLNQVETAAVIDFIKRTEDKCGVKCDKVTADTLARVMAGGNENSPEDMGTLIRNADSIRDAIGCCFEFIHHSGKDVAKGARGHSSLRAATDTEIEICVKADGVRVARTSKQRDLEINQTFAFSLKPIEIGTDRYGHPVTTCIPEWILDYEAPIQPVKEKSPPDQAIKALALLRDLQQQAERNVRESGTGTPKVDKQWFNKELSDKLGIKYDSNRARILRTLKEFKLVEIDGLYIKLI